MEMNAKKAQGKDSKELHKKMASQMATENLFIQGVRRTSFS